MLVKLAWRNLWRQKRRTLLTASALALALALSLFMRCLQEGTYANNIDNAARFYTGLIQLQHPDFSQTNSIDDLIPEDDEFIWRAKSFADISNALPRIESFSLAAAGDKSKGVMVMGVLPEEEDAYSGISGKLAEGVFLQAGDKEVLVGLGLSRFLDVKIGDELVLYGLGYQGQTAAGLYRVKGILDFPVPQLDNQLVYMPLPLAQSLYSACGKVTTWVLHTDELESLQETVSQLETDYEGVASVRDWEDLAPEMAQQMLMDKAGGIFMMYLLYGVVGFGLFATLLMMTLERQREFGVMLATGLLRRKLVALISIESLFIGLLGVLIGLAISLPLLGWFTINPITLTGETAQMVIEMGWDPVLPLMVEPWLFFDQIRVVLGLLAICLLYPMWRIYRLELVVALKGGSHAG